MSISSKIDMNWVKIGLEMGTHLIWMVATLGIVLVAWRRFMAPPIMEALENANKSMKTLSVQGNIRYEEFAALGELVGEVGGEIIIKQIPELEALKLILDTGTWDKIEDAIENNPAAVIQLYEKWKHMIPGASQTQDKFDF